MSDGSGSVASHLKEPSEKRAKKVGPKDNETGERHE
jgi:hypothetical protein